MNTTTTPTPSFLVRKVKISLLTIIRLFPTLAYLFCLIYLYRKANTFNYIINVPNLLFLVFMTIFPKFMFRCESLSCSLFLLRTIKEVGNVESPSEFHFDNLELFITSFSSWLFEASFWLTLFIKFILLMYHIAKAVREYESGEMNNLIKEEDKKYMNELPINEYKDYQKQCEMNQINTRNECAICLDFFKQNDEIIAMTKCDHIFHKTCIQKWFLLRTNCPYCRTNVLPEKNLEENEEGNERSFHFSDLFIIPRLELPVPIFNYPSFRFYS